MKLCGAVKDNSDLVGGPQGGAVNTKLASLLEVCQTQRCYPPRFIWRGLWPCIFPSFLCNMCGA